MVLLRLNTTEPSVRWKTISAALFGVGMFKKNSAVQIFSSEEHAR